MNREEILEKSRMQKEDEGKVKAEEKGSLLGLSVMGGLSLLILLFNNVIAEKTELTIQTNFVIYTLFFGALSMKDLTIWKFSRKKWKLIGAALGIFLALVSLGCYIHSVLR